VTRLLRQFLIFSFGYFVFSLVLLLLFREDVAQILLFAIAKARAEVFGFIRFSPWLLVLIAILYFLSRRFNLRARLSPAAFAFAGVLFFSAGFSLIKTTLPQIVPFYADPFFAALDRWLHFGTDPWRLAHLLSRWISPEFATTIYFDTWFLPGLFLPVIIAATDTELLRSRRFLLLYVVAWAGIGNVLALAGMSVGPIFYDRLLGGDEFGGLLSALKLSGIESSQFGSLQNTLWDALQENQQAIGSGISAFPSVHVAMATVFGLYLSERVNWLTPLAVVYVGLILFFSVYVGWHYAVDGYFSVLLIVAVWAGQKYFAARRSGKST
jgi:PAP2 superfamily protein